MITLLPNSWLTLRNKPYPNVSDNIPEVYAGLKRDELSELFDTISIQSLYSSMLLFQLFGYGFEEIGLFNANDADSSSIAALNLETSNVMLTGKADWGGLSMPGEGYAILIRIRQNLASAATGQAVETLFRSLDMPSNPVPTQAIWIIKVDDILDGLSGPGGPRLAKAVYQQTFQKNIEITRAIADIIPAVDIQTAILEGALRSLSVFNITADKIAEPYRAALAEPLENCFSQVWNWMTASPENLELFIYGEWGDEYPGDLKIRKSFWQKLCDGCPGNSFQDLWKTIDGSPADLPRQCVELFNAQEMDGILHKKSPFRLNFSRFVWFLHNSEIINIIPTPDIEEEPAEAEPVEIEEVPFGRPERVPQATFISGQASVGDTYIDNAIAYHSDWGLNPRIVDSLQEIAEILAEDNGVIDRIRIVGHANDEGLNSALFKGAPRTTLKIDVLRAFDESDAAVLRIYNPPGISSDYVGTLLETLRRSHADVLRPFDLQETGPPDPKLEIMMRYGLDLRHLRTTFSELQKKKGKQIEIQQIEVLISATEIILEKLRKELGDDAPYITDEDVSKLYEAIVGGSIHFTFTHDVVIPPEDRFRATEATVKAIEGGFRDTLNQLRARFRSESWIDIRGCQAGKNDENLEAIAEFFGPPGNLPRVSAPKWLQTFVPREIKSLSRDEVLNFKSDPDNRQTLDEWLGYGDLREVMDDSGLKQDVEALRGYYQAYISYENQNADGKTGESPAVPQPPALKTPLTIPGPLDIDLAQRELDLLNLDSADAIFYFLVMQYVLPAVGTSRKGEKVLLLYMSEDHMNEAMGNWLALQWDKPPAGLAYLQKMDPKDEAPRRCSGMGNPDDRAEPPIVSPGLAYWEQIEEFP